MNGNDLRQIASEIKAGEAALNKLQTIIDSLEDERESFEKRVKDGNPKALKRIEEVDLVLCSRKAELKRKQGDLLELIYKEIEMKKVFAELMRNCAPMFTP